MDLLHILGSPTESSPTAADRVPRADVTALYVHVPFCFHKCHYCDFYSITHQTPQRMARFVDLVLREAERWAASGELPLVRPKTVFFGGGTPSLLPGEQMRRLLLGLREPFNFEELNEWTVECNPATVDADYCAMLRECGVTRLSFGAQSFDPAQLKTLERHHDPSDVARSVALARDAGFHRLNLDLIYAIPGQDLASWLDSLETAISLGTPHLSCYGLTYEANTPLAVKRRLGHVRAVDDDLELRMLHATRARLASAGYTAYEISNYALQGEECRHNLVYWNGENYLGLGPSAASHVAGTRWRNRAHLGEWETAVQRAGGLPATDLEVLSPARRAGELAYLQLRLAAGVRYADFQDRTGFDARALYAEPIRRLSCNGLLEGDENGFRLTDRGLNVADAIAAEFLAPISD
jgi:oxygen-independent coproporphyrinogen-3 oxidase